MPFIRNANTAELGLGVPRGGNVSALSSFQLTEQLQGFFIEWVIVSRRMMSLRPDCSGPQDENKACRCHAFACYEGCFLFVLRGICWVLTRYNDDRRFARYHTNATRVFKAIFAQSPGLSPY